jgi:large subunit ribosomal protein L9
LSPKKERFVKVIFLEDVPKVAKAGQSKEVADGYARNFLLPRKLAVLASSQTAAAVETHLKKVTKQRAIEEAEMSELAKMINGMEITLKAKVGENEKLYGSVTGADIAEALSKNINREIDKRKVELAEPIRQVGIYDVTIRFTHEITAVVNVTVMSDEEGAEKPVKAEKKAEEAAVPAEEKKEEKAEEKPEKVAKKEKKVKKEKPPKAEKEEKPPKEKKAKPEKAVKEEKPEKEAKPPKEKKAKPEKAAKEEKPEKEVKPAEETKKEKKPRAKAKKTEAPVEEKKETEQGE